MPAVTKYSTKRRESASLWFRQLLAGQERQGTAKAAAAAWLGTIYALRASARLDGNKEWGKVGDDMIGILEHAYLENMGKEGQQQIEFGRRLLRHHETIQELPEMLPEIKVDSIKIPVVKTPNKIIFQRPAVLDKLRAQVRKAQAARPASKPVAKAKKKAR
jgi:hypothetical protein